ncbi:MAG: hypothetical protein ACFFBP_21750 [Promethearchaeota archaeon]
MYYQKDFALEAVKRGSIAVALKSETDACLLIHLDEPASLGEILELERCFKIDEHVGVACTGLESDARVLINYSREKAQLYKVSYDKPIRLETLAKRVGHFCQNYSQFGWKRPFGCTLLFIGVDKNGLQVFKNSQDGNYRSYNACAMGFNSNIANNYLLSSYNEKLSFNELVNLLLYVVKISIDEKLTKDNIRIGYINSEDQMFNTFTLKDNEKFLNNMKVPKKFNESVSKLNDALEHIRSIFKREDLRKMIIERKYLMEFFDESLIKYDDPDFRPTLIPLVTSFFKKNGIEIMYHGNLVIFLISNRIDFENE